MKKRTKTLMQYINAHGGDATFKHGPGKNLTIEQCQEIIVDLSVALKEATTRKDSGNE